jgi:hypothetical protein
MKWWVKTFSYIFLFLIIMIFGYEKMCFIWKGVKIEATIEKKNDSSLAEIKGRASKATYITLNGREIFVDRDGNFSESVSMLPGFSIITLHAKDKFGKTADKKFEVVYEGNAPSIALLKN